MQNHSQYNKLIYTIISLIVINGILITALFIAYEFHGNVYNAVKLFFLLLWSIWIGIILLSLTFIVNLIASIAKKNRKLKGSFINLFSAYFCIYTFIIWFISYLMGMEAVVEHWLIASICGILGILLLIDSFKKNKTTTNSRQAPAQDLTSQQN